MAQLYYLDSGAMIWQGKTAGQYQSEPMWSWDPLVHGIANSPQTFPAKWKRRDPPGGAWLYVPVIGEFFRKIEDTHPILVAAATLFTPERWEEIEDLLEELGDVSQMLWRKSFKKLRRKVQRARANGSITVEEAQKLASVAAHLPNGT